MVHTNMQRLLQEIIWALPLVWFSEQKIILKFHVHAVFAMSAAGQARESFHCAWKKVLIDLWLSLYILVAKLFAIFRFNTCKPESCKLRISSREPEEDILIPPATVNPLQPFFHNFLLFWASDSARLEFELNGKVVTRSTVIAMIC
ncbi:hypothetical protein MFRU_008g02850 [Monilinia fructicola]|nr:hypothetical protein MFRU_008g02850 [Monilinia fructicola]